MSTIRQNEKHQIRVPSKLVDSDYGTKNVKNKKNKKSKQLDELDQEVCNTDSENRVEMEDKENKVDELNKDKCVKDSCAGSYASIAKNNCLDRKLYLIPTEFRDDGSEVVVFDEEIMEEGSKKWSLTVCGYFVGYKMSYQELAYNLFRMWGKFGLKHIILNGNGVFLFKFKSEVGIQSVIENGPWMVNRKPMFVQKWDPSVFLDRTEPTKLPLWTAEEIDEMNKAKEKKKEDEKKAMENEDFIQVRNRRKPSTYVNQPVKNVENNQGKKKNNVVYRQVVRRKVNEENDMGSGNKESVFSSDEVNRGSPEVKASWKVHEGIIDSIRKSANKYSVLENEPDGTDFVEGVNEVIEEQNDVYEEVEVAHPLTDQWILQIASWNIRGLRKISKQNDVKNLIQNENLCICAVLETRLKGEKVRRIGGKVFGRWDWTMGKMRRKLWVDISAYKSINNNCPWVILGDLNLCLNIDDHSEGMSHSTQDMEDFQDCVNNLKIEDIGSTGLYFTWTKSLLNPESSVFKKIDRVMGSEEFFDMHKGAHVLVKKLKALKPVMNNLNWQNGNLVDKVKRLKNDLDEIQMKIDKNSYDKLLRENGVAVLKDYSIALEDEEKLMFQRAKVNWLNDGDRNSVFFHKIIKSRMDWNRVDEIWGAYNVRYHGDQVPIQFVSHFKAFLGVQNDKECMDLDPSIFLNKINPQDAYAMVGDVSNDEIKAAMFSIDDNKAPDPDGYTGKLLGELNLTLITLVPKVVKQALDEFSCASRIYFNLGKSTILCGSMDRVTIENILAFLPFKRGKLPVRYLGVLLVAKKIGIKDCESLIDKVKTRIHDWKNKSLSYAGRTQLIASVLASIQVYWASLFKLPKTVTKDIER
ncbi:RNA-directed DNA polymerase, eukaryota, reverse transcriptase zinc-binding domain protein, partial [Tanacetum coccineum]